MPVAELIVCEGKPRWVPALRLSDADLPIRQCTTLDNCNSRLAACPASLVAVEITEKNLSAALRWLSQCGRRWPEAVAVALGQATVSEYDAALYEAGAVQVFHSLAELNHLTQIAKCHLARQPQPAKGPLEQFGEQLPWSDSLWADNQ